MSSDWKHDSFSAPQVLMMGWLLTPTRLFPASYWQGSKVKVMQIGDPVCQPAILALEQHRDPGTLWRWLVAEILQASEHFKQRASNIHAETEGGRGEKGKTQWPGSAFKGVAVRWSRSNNNRERRGPGWVQTENKHIFLGKAREDVAQLLGSEPMRWSN